MQVNSQIELEKINAQLNNLRVHYGNIATQIENLMKQNATASIVNYQEQLNALIQQRDALSSKISEQMSVQKAYQTIVDYEREEIHKSTIWQVEQLLGIRITNTAGIEVDANRFGGVPQVIVKDTNVLNQEFGNINQQLKTLFNDGQLDLKTYQTMKKAVRDEYNKFSKNAPKPVKKEESLQHQQTQFQQANTTSTTQQDKNDLFREKYGYSDMSEEEKMEFDEKLERQREAQTRDSKKTKDDSISEKQQILKTGWKRKFKEMKKQGFEAPNLDNISRQQETIEQQDKNDLFREKYGYSDMSEEEKMEFDERLKRQQEIIEQQQIDTIRLENTERRIM